MKAIEVVKWQSDVRETLDRGRSLQKQRMGNFSWVDMAKRVEVLTARIAGGNVSIIDRKLELVQHDVMRQEVVMLTLLVERAASWVRHDKVAYKKVIHVAAYLHTIQQAIDTHLMLTNLQKQGKPADNDQIMRLETVLFRQLEPYKIQLMDSLEAASNLPADDEGAKQLALAGAVRGWTTQPIDPATLR